MCFQDSERYLCTKHMKDNLKHFLIGKEEMDEKRRRHVINEIFGPGGLVDSNGSFAFEEHSSRIKLGNRKYEHFVKCFESSLKSSIIKNVENSQHMNHYGQILPVNHSMLF